MSVMSAQKPDSRRSPHPYAINLRISTAHYRHLVLEAERQSISMAEATRRCIDAAIDATPVITDEEGSPAIKYRNLLGILDGDALDALAASLADDTAAHGGVTSDDHEGDGGSA
jgi:hypothetical protein